MRRFYTIAQQHGLPTGDEANEPMQKALGELLGEKITSRKQLTATQWSEVASAIKREDLRWNCLGMMLNAKNATRCSCTPCYNFRRSKAGNSLCCRAKAKIMNCQANRCTKCNIAIRISTESSVIWHRAWEHAISDLDNSFLRNGSTLPHFHCSKCNHLLSIMTIPKVSHCDHCGSSLANMNLVVVTTWSCTKCKHRYTRDEVLNLPQDEASAMVHIYMSNDQSVHRGEHPYGAAFGVSEEDFNFEFEEFLNKLRSNSHELFVHNCPSCWLIDRSLLPMATNVIDIRIKPESETYWMAKADIAFNCKRCEFQVPATYPITVGFRYGGSKNPFLLSKSEYSRSLQHTNAPGKPRVSTGSKESEGMCAGCGQPLGFWQKRRGDKHHKGC